MIQTDNLVQWQLYDEKTDAIFPWFVHPFLEWLDAQDFSKCRVLEFGSGRSTRWWRKRAAWVTSIEANEEWFKQVAEECRDLANGVIWSKNINEGDQSNAALYTDIGDRWGPYDVVVTDGILRHECVLKALSMPRPLLLIVDNWQQNGFECPASEEALSGFEIHNYIQENHTDNHGKKWATMWTLLEGRK